MPVNATNIEKFGFADNCLPSTQRKYFCRNSLRSFLFPNNAEITIREILAISNANEDRFVDEITNHQMWTASG